MWPESILFLASEGWIFLTGQVLCPNGETVTITPTKQKWWNNC